MHLEKMLKRDVIIRFTKSELSLYAQIYLNMHESAKQRSKIMDRIYEEPERPLFALEFINNVEQMGIPVRKGLT